MAIVSGDLQRRLSGGLANADVDLSLGGKMSSVAITNASLHNLFDLVTGAEAAAGDIEYRCFYVRNNHGSLTLKAAKIWISTETTSGDTNIDIGLDPAGAGNGDTTGQAFGPVGDEGTAPTGPVFTHPITEGAALSIGDLAAGEGIGIWVEWTINAAAAAIASDDVIMTFKGDTAA
jgi:hypothetical protein